MARFYGREYFEVDTLTIALEMGMSEKATESLLRRATRKFQAKLKEQLGDSVTLYDILPTLSGRGDYNEPLQSL